MGSLLTSGLGFWNNWKTFCKATKTVKGNAVPIPVLDILPTSYRILIKYLLSNDDMSLQELGNVGRAWLALAMMCGPCMDGDGIPQ